MRPSSRYKAESRENFNKIDLEIALDKVKLANKNVLLLFYKEGLSYEEISEAIGRPLGTVKTLLRRAKQELLKYY